jgi:5-methylcytosine-specific restriction enzyme A
MSTIQHAEARKLLPILYSVVTKHRPPLTYATAAKELGRNPKTNSRMVAQVCDLLDAAAYLAGVPLLALIAVRQKDGNINPMAWRQDPERKEEVIYQSQGHRFTDADIQAITGALDRFEADGISNKTAWSYVRNVLGRDQTHRRPTVDQSKLRQLGQRNPTWTRDELIVTLDFYLRYEGNPPSKDSNEIRDLSLFLNRLGAQGPDAAPDFRNPNGVYMKLMNFRRLDPVFSSQGKVGLQRGGKGEEEVWAYFSTRRDELRTTADAIRSVVASGELVTPAEEEETDLAEAEEGGLLSRMHRYRERSRKLVKSKKAEVLKKNGSLTCEVCLFDFGSTYGERGNGFIEVHHTRPLQTLTPGSKTKLEDLALLCANCHRMIHAKRPWLDLLALRQLLNKSTTETVVSNAG